MTYYYSRYDKVTGRFSGSGSSSSELNVTPIAGEGLIEGHYDHTTQMVVDGDVVNIPDDIVEREQIEQAWVAVRATRNQMLASCDWTQVNDAPVDKAAWAIYRQALRDLPENTKDPRFVTWPQQP